MKATSHDKRSSLATTTGAFLAPGLFKGLCQHRTAIKRIGALAGLDLGESLNKGDALGLGKALDSVPLRFYAKARATLALG